MVRCLRDSHLRYVQPLHAAAWVEDLQRRVAAPSVKLSPAATRMLFDWLVIGQVISNNPASAVRGPKYSVKKGKTPMLSAEEACALLDSIDTSTVVGLRDRAASIRTKIGCHTFRATGITEYLRNGGKLEVAQQMANHESARTTGLYDRRNDQVSLDEVERILI
jgi:site-specific recombinase XerD